MSARVRIPAQLLRDSVAAARAAELRYVSLDEPGITRRARNGSFIYTTPRGLPLRDARQLRRIAALGIPPAWQNVWICSSENGHIQATGFDARSRKQYRYHPRWRKVRDEAKYHDILYFAEALPRLRKALARDLADTSLSKQKVLATVVAIMEQTRIRVGNDRYAETNKSYGLTTLLDQHAKISGQHVEFRFRGKGGKPYRAAIRDRKLANIVKRCRDVPGQRLFQYIDDQGEARPISSTDVNEYIQTAMGQAFTAKNFRTWAGTVGAALVLHRFDPSRSVAHGKRVLKQAIELVAQQLGNTQAICRKCYVHPAVVDAYVNGELHDHMPECMTLAKRKRCKWLRVEECAVLALFERLARDGRVPERIAA
ncbi:MAG TPA: DNA topoisomerase IB [Polyangiaceae bacterium]|nr:DNA topoisomerase IB [Polyangiaceae bacterium]